MYQRIHGELNQRGVWNFQFTQRVELRFHLYVAQIPRKEIHDGVVLMQQTTLHILVSHLIAKHGAAHRIAHITDTLGSIGRQPSLRILTKQQHSGNCHLAVRTNKAQVPQQTFQTDATHHKVSHLFYRKIAQVHLAYAALLHHNCETIQQILLQHLLVHILDAEILNSCLVWCETATLAHHLSQLGIVKHLSFICTILHPHDALIVVIWLVQSLLYRRNHNAASIYLCRIDIQQNTWYDIFRRHIAQHVGCFLHLLIRQGVHHASLVVDSNHQLTTMRIAECHYFTANIVLVCDALLELHLGHLAMIS